MKLTDRIQYSAANLTDLIHIVVTGDTSQNPAGSSYKVTLEQVIALVPPSTNSSGDTYWISGSTWSGGSFSIKANNNSGLDATGNYALAEGSGTTASGRASHAEGSGTIASGLASHAEGNKTTASGRASHAEGGGHLIEGPVTTFFPTIATAEASHSEGWGTIASGIASHAEGSYTTASGSSSHAEGLVTTALGSYSHAEGDGTIASGSSSHAEGYLTTAIGTYSHAGGSGSISSGSTSFVHGTSSIAGGSNTIVFGANITGTSANTTYVDGLNIKTVGSGTSVYNLGIDVGGNVITNINQINGYNVKDYGLLGDGITDDSAALNTLLNTTAPTGSTIYFPPGNYIINTPVIVLDKQFFWDGAFATIIANSNGRICDISSTTDLASKWKFTNLIFKGTGSGSNQYGFYFSANSGSFVFDNCSFDDFGGGGVAVANTNNSTSLGGLFNGCKFYDNIIGIDASLSRAEYLQIIGCDFFTNGTGIICNSGNILINGCNINYNTIGISLLNGVNDSHGIISSNNINHNTTNLSINGISYGMTFSNNNFYQGNFSIINSPSVKFIGGIIDLASYTLTNNSDLSFEHVTFQSGYTNTVALTGTTPTFFKCTGTIPAGYYNNNGAWIDYSSSSTLIGWSSTSQKEIKFTLIGKTVLISFNINGTSNSAATSFTVPFTSVAPHKVTSCYATSNGVPITTGGVCWNNSGTGIIDIFSDWALNSSFSLSGAKQVIGYITIEI